MECPNCKARLRKARYEGVRIETCLSCKGEWLYSDALTEIIKVREARFKEEERQAILKASSLKGVCLRDLDRNLFCPKCGETTDPINYGGNSGIIIDRCTGCKGIWLDAKELEKIQMVAENWQDHLSGDLAKFSPKLRKISEIGELERSFKHSSLGFINSVVNGVIDIQDA